MICLYICILLFSSYVFSHEKLKIDEHSVKDKEHLSGHAKGENMKKPVESMNDDELEFFYFHEHDKDHNKLLDGNELIMSIIEHMELNKNKTENTNTSEEKFSENEIKDFVQQIFEYDENNDGYLNLHEFRKIYRKDD